MAVKRKRTILTFEPFHTRELIAAELRHRKKMNQKAALRQLIEEAVLAYLGPKYPKLCQTKT